MQVGGFQWFVSALGAAVRHPMLHVQVYMHKPNLSIFGVREVNGK